MYMLSWTIENPDGKTIVWNILYSKTKHFVELARLNLHYARQWGILRLFFWLGLPPSLLIHASDVSFKKILWRMTAFQRKWLPWAQISQTCLDPYLEITSPILSCECCSEDVQSLNVLDMCRLICAQKHSGKPGPFESPQKRLAKLWPQNWTGTSGVNLSFKSQWNGNKCTYKILYFLPTWIIKVPVFLHVIHSVAQYLQCASLQGLTPNSWEKNPKTLI